MTTRSEQSTMEELKDAVKRASDVKKRKEEKKEFQSERAPAIERVGANLHNRLNMIECDQSHADGMLLHHAAERVILKDEDDRFQACGSDLVHTGIAVLLSLTWTTLVGIPILNRVTVYTVFKRIGIVL